MGTGDSRQNRPDVDSGGGAGREGTAFSVGAEKSMHGESICKGGKEKRTAKELQEIPNE